MKSKKNQSSKPRWLRSITIGLGVVSAGILGYFLTRTETAEDVARKVLACVERADGACVNRYRWELDKQEQPISDAEMSRFLREFAGARLNFSQPLESPNISKSGAEINIVRRYQGGPVSLRVVQTTDGYRTVGTITTLVLCTYNGTQPIHGRARAKAWVSGLTKDKSLLNSYGIIGLERQPRGELELIDDYCRRMTLVLSNPIPKMKP